MTSDRVIHWPDCRNTRDLGGLPTVDGGFVRAWALIRSDGLDRLTADGVDALRGAGVRRIIDLRSADETAAYPSPFGGDPVCLSLPLIDPQRELERDVSVERTALTTYRGSISRNAGPIAAAVAAIVDAPPGPVVVHCAAGKDRTGMIVALVLRVAGVSREVIAADYAFSGGRDPDTILGTLSHVDDLFGDVPGYLVAAGLTPAQLSRLKSRLRDCADGSPPLA